MEIIRILPDSGQPIFLIEEDGRYVPLPDDFWRRKVSNYRYLTREGKEKQQRKLLKTVEVKNVRIRADQPPAWRKIHNDDGKHAPTETDCRQGVETLMSLLDVFPTPEAGAMLLATLLMSLRAADLKQCEPSLRPCVAFREPPQLEPALKSLFRHILPRKQWEGKRFSVRRKCDRPGRTPRLGGHLTGQDTGGKAQIRLASASAGKHGLAGSARSGYHLG